MRTRVELDKAGSWIVAEISDTGRGIAPEQMGNLWAMFHQSADGLGFGLWWVRTFIERQGGTIACDSTPGAALRQPGRRAVGAGRHRAHQRADPVCRRRSWGKHARQNSDCRGLCRLAGAAERSVAT
ncbi:ATP-binding protein [Chloroflexota bacterium]